MINAGVLKFDAQGRILTTNANPGPHFNGGTPVVNGMLCVLNGPAVYYNGGFGYGIRGRVCATQSGANPQGPIVNGLGRVRGTTDPPAFYYAGLPMAANGLLCLAPPV